MKFCKDCKHFVEAWAYPYGFVPAGCSNPALRSAPEPIYGKTYNANPERERKEGLCGLTGELFEAKEPTA